MICLAPTFCFLLGAFCYDSCRLSAPFLGACEPFSKFCRYGSAAGELLCVATMSIVPVDYSFGESLMANDERRSYCNIL